MEKNLAVSASSKILMQDLLQEVFDMSKCLTSMHDDDPLPTKIDLRMLIIDHKTKVAKIIRTLA